MDTHFAPAERSPLPEWARQVTALTDHPLVSVLLDSVGGHLVILNGQRQILAANREFLSLLGHLTLEALPGRRLGELLACQNALSTEGGCGTTSACANCGAVLAILEVLDTRLASEKECHLCTTVDGRHRATEYRVKASPLEIGDELFVVFVFQDISADKRREAMETIFFHDLRNLLGGLSGAGELLALDAPHHAANSVLRMSRLLNAEVEAQVLLSRAEAGDTAVHREPCTPLSLADDLVELFALHPCARNKHLQIGTLAPVTLVTDKGVVLRILVNMVKNAMEASSAGETVEVSAEARGTGVRFLVSNPGVMAPEVAARVFERTFSTKKEPGRGLGTYAMRLFAETFLGGQVGFTSREGEGTRFFLDID